MTKARFDHACKIAALDALNEERNRVNETKKHIECVELEKHLGQLVIVVSNEPTNPMVAFAKSIDFITQAHVPVLVVQDLVTKEDFIPFGKVFSYTKQKFDALNSLDPNSRIAIVYENAYEGNVDKIVPETVVPSNIWANKVNEAIKVWFSENEH